jgi:hypothetical protein
MSFDDLARRMAESRGESVGALGDASVDAIRRDNQASAARSQIMYGIALLVIGVVITAVTFSSASQSGGTYYIVYGPIVVGVIKIIRGLIAMPDRTPEQVAAAGRVSLPTARTISPPEERR